jgi:uncharacterized protein
MLISVKAIPESKHMTITKISDTRFEVHLRSKAERGEANAELRLVLGAYFSVPPSRIRIIAGHHAEHKVIEVVV